MAGYKQNKTQLFPSWQDTNRTKLNYFLVDGVQTEHFLSGGVQIEQNSTIFWVAGYEQNSVTYILTNIHRPS